MSDIGAGNSAFDAIFFMISATGALLVLLSTLVLLAWRKLRGRDLPRWPSVALVVAAILLGPGLSIYWQAAFPSANGIEGAGRFIFGGTATLGNATFAGLSAFVMLDRRVRWVALAPAGLVIAFWVSFLFL
jgi:hypothetical protein